MVAAAMRSGAPITYRIDGDDRLIDVCDNWHTFALANGGGMLSGRALLGRTLWEFIADPSTVHLYQIIVDRIRRGGNVVRFQLRCDAPDRRRLLTMEISGEEAGVVAFRTTPVHDEPRAAVPEPKGPPLLPVCGWCSRVRLEEDRWVEPEAAVDALGIFRSRGVPDVTHGMCPDCYAAISEALDLSDDGPDVR